MTLSPSLEPLLARDDLKSSTAFLAQRAATVAGDKEAAARWAERVAARVRRDRAASLLTKDEDGVGEMSWNSASVALPLIGGASRSELVPFFA